ncbi:MAG: PEP/pyruvate-binding domain-containing protein, partial [Salinibacter sp.]
MATTTDQKYVYKFGEGDAEGNRNQTDLLGGKGANLNEMSGIGLPVPPGYTITTEACHYYVDHDGQWPEGMGEQVRDGLRFVEEAMDQRFGDPDNPLLVSVRSGAAKSMPGMMDSVLNLGLNDESVQGLAQKTNNERFAYDAYRRLIDMFGDVVMGIDRSRFEESISALKEERGADSDVDLTARDLRDLVDRYKAIYRDETGESFPQAPLNQLERAINAVFDSWMNERAVRYRQINNITGLRGTAVNVQTMVYGNLGEDSGTGVCFTRNPATGEGELYGEFLRNAQGEDVVAGIRTPRDIQELDRLMPEIYEELQDICYRLEAHYGEMQDLEFTVQEGTLYILQTRDGKRTGPAAVKIAVDMVDEDLIDEERAVKSLVEPDHLNQLLHPRFDPDAEYENDILGEGLPASPGAAVGQAVFTAEDAEEWNAQGKDVILVRTETSPEDVGGM